MSVLGNAQQIRDTLQKVIKDKSTFSKSAQYSFEQFDKDKSGKLDKKETQELLNRLYKNLQLPAIDDVSFEKVFCRYDDGDCKLTSDEFSTMYYEVLVRARDDYYPDKKTRVRRSFFVGTEKVQENQKISDLIEFKGKIESPSCSSYGQMHNCKDKKSGMDRVCLTINKSNVKDGIPAEQVCSEVEILKSVDHPNVVKMFNSYEDYNSIYLIVESCMSNSLRSKLSECQKTKTCCSESYMACVMKQVLEALTHCHSKKICHKNINPDTIMIDNVTSDTPVVKLSDFGMAEMFDSYSTSAKSCTTNCFMAPEVYKQCYSMQCDIFSAGATMYLMLTGCLPFESNTDMEKMKNTVMNCEPDYAKQCSSLSSDCIEIMRSMMTKDYTKRPNARTLLKNKWLTSAKSDSMKLSPDAVQSMQKYMKSCEVRRGIQNIMTHQLSMSSDKVRSMVQMFSTLDCNHDGMLSHSELTKGLQAMDIKQADVNLMCQNMDVDDSGKVDYTEFLAACYCFQENQTNEVWAAFKTMDASGDGKISSDELCTALCGKDSSQSAKDEVMKTVTEMDKDKSGSVDWDEFLQYMNMKPSTPTKTTTTSPPSSTTTPAKTSTTPPPSSTTTTPAETSTTPPPTSTTTK